MDPLHLTHLMVLCFWGGVVLVEGVVELAPKDDAGLLHATRVHYWIDLLIELPLLAGVLASGAALAVRGWPLGITHWVKIGAGLVAVGVNFYCVGAVVQRHRSKADVALVRRYSRRVRLSFVGIPFGLLAAYLGLAYFRA